MSHILIIEDDFALNTGIKLCLQEEKHQFYQVYTLAEARNYLHTPTIDLVILDLNLPDGNGLEFLKEFRKQSNTPVLILSANDMELDIVTGLELGANDYVTKPFSLMVLRARIRTQLRLNKHQPSNKFVIDDFIFDFDTMEYSKSGRLIKLSDTEQKILKNLVSNKGITLTRNQLIDSVWTDGLEYVDENALSVAMKRLRDKLEINPSKPDYIKTIYGIGYVWAVIRHD